MDMPSEVQMDMAPENSVPRETTCLMIAAAIHALLLLLNPILLKSDWQPAHDFVTVEVVDNPSPGAPAVEAPKKMSLMDTLKDMLTRPSEQIAHVAPMPTQTPVAQPAQPKLMDRSTSHPLATTFTPKSQMEDLANTANANRINVNQHVVTSLPAASPTLHSQTFKGIRPEDLPFQTSNESINNANAVPINIGRSSAKSALGYAGPQITDKGHKTEIAPLVSRAGAPVADVATLGAGAPATIPLAGVSNQTAPTGNTAPLTNRQGASSGGLVNRALLGGRGSNVGTGIEGVPAARQAEEVAAASTASNRQAKKNGVNLEGPLSNRAIVHKVIPQYPAWAEEQGIVGSVQIYFTVDAAGNVRQNMQVRKTTGYPQLDQLAVEALKQWKFAASSAEGEWGLITFNFSLSS